MLLLSEVREFAILGLLFGVGTDSGQRTARGGREEAQRGGQVLLIGNKEAKMRLKGGLFLSASSRPNILANLIYLRCAKSP